MDDDRWICHPLFFCVKDKTFTINLIIYFKMIKLNLTKYKSHCIITYDYDSDSSSSTKYLLDATQAILRIHDKLGVPDYVYQEMLDTKSLDGRRTYSGSKINISWTYHPDKGLEVLYTR